MSVTVDEFADVIWARVDAVLTRAQIEGVISMEQDQELYRRLYSAFGDRDDDGTPLVGESDEEIAQRRTRVDRLSDDDLRDLAGTFARWGGTWPRDGDERAVVAEAVQRRGLVVEPEVAAALGIAVPVEGAQ